MSNVQFFGDLLALPTISPHLEDFLPAFLNTFPVLGLVLVIENATSLVNYRCRPLHPGILQGERDVSRRTPYGFTNPVLRPLSGNRILCQGQDALLLIPGGERQAALRAVRLD